MKFEVKQIVKIEDGKQQGQIVGIEYRTQPYEYTDIIVKEKVSGFEMKYGCPSVINENSRLGRLLSNFIELKIGNKVDPEKVLTGLEVEFMTIKRKSQKNGKEYSEIVEDSIKPLSMEKRVENAK